MLNKFGRLTSLEEDFAEIGLGRDSKNVAVFGTLEEEFAEADEFANELSEALKVQKLKRMSPSERASARADYRKQKTKIKVAKKKLRKKPAFKRKQAKLKKLKKGRVAGPRKRFVVAGLDKIGNLRESIEKYATEINGSQQEEIKKLLENVISVAGLVANKLDEAEVFVDEMIAEDIGNEMRVDEFKTAKEAIEFLDNGGIVIDPSDDETEMSRSEILDWFDNESEFGPFDEEDEPSGPQDGTGPYGRLNRRGDGPCVKEDELSFLDDDEEEGEDEIGYEESEEEESEEYVDNEEEKNESRISDNLRSLAEDATGILSKLATSELTPKDAESVLRDMVSYLGGAIQSLIDITKAIKENQVVGQDEPKEVGVSPENQSEPRKVVGDDKELEGQDKIKEKKEPRKVVGDDEDLQGVAKKPEGQSEPRKVIGKDKELQKNLIAPIRPIGDRKEVGKDQLKGISGGFQNIAFNQVGKGEISVYESLDSFTKELVDSVATQLTEENRKEFLRLDKKSMVDMAYSIASQFMDKKKV